MKWTNPFILQNLLKYNALKTNLKITLFWIPSHVNIPGNDRADAAAKKALKNPITNLTIPYSDFRSKVSRYLVDCWQSSWSLETSNKLHSINPKVGTKVPIHSSSHREDVVITRLRLGHTHLTHSFLLSNSLNPSCPFCGIDTSIHHFLITYPLYDNNRSSLSSPNSYLQSLPGKFLPNNHQFHSQQRSFPKNLNLLIHPLTSLSDTPQNQTSILLQNFRLTRYGTNWLSQCH